MIEACADKMKEYDWLPSNWDNPPQEPCSKCGRMDPCCGNNPDDTRHEIKLFLEAALKHADTFEVKHG